MLPKFTTCPISDAILSRVGLVFASFFFVLSTVASEHLKIEPEDVKLQGIYIENGILYFEDGSEVTLWGVNLQTAMSWEFQRYQRAGIFNQFNLEEWIKITDRSLDEIQLMGCDVIRIHLSPGDLADKSGNLVETPWLKMLDYTLAECRRRGIYVNLALLNHLGHYLDESFIGRKHGKQSKWEWITVPEKIAASENYIRQLANRRNPYDEYICYKDNPAWVVAELINEPMFPRDKPRANESPSGVRVYKEWLLKTGKTDTSGSFSEYKYKVIKAYINRMVGLLEEENVSAIPCWNLFWIGGPQHEGWESYDAAADSNIRLVSFSTYPGQKEIQEAGRKPMNLSGENFLPYLRDAYENRDRQGWLREDRFKGKSARIVYEFEAWANQSAYIYPAMAKYFRSQGAQIATMWTYSMPLLANYFNRTWNHNLNIRTTPRKAAGFMVAGEIFRNTPRYIPYQTSTAVSDHGNNYLYSFENDSAAFFDNKHFISSGDVDFQDTAPPESFERLASYGSSPFVDYQGNGIYFLERVKSSPDALWKLRILPHSRTIDDSAGTYGLVVELDAETAFPIKLRLPEPAIGTSIYKIENGKFRQLDSISTEHTVKASLGSGEYYLKRESQP